MHRKPGAVSFAAAFPALVNSALALCCHRFQKRGQHGASSSYKATNHKGGLIAGGNVKYVACHQWASSGADGEKQAQELCDEMNLFINEGRNAGTAFVTEADNTGAVITEEKI